MINKQRKKVPMLKELLEELGFDFVCVLVVVDVEEFLLSTMFRTGIQGSNKETVLLLEVGEAAAIAAGGDIDVGVLLARIDRVVGIFCSPTVLEV